MSSNDINGVKYGVKYWFPNKKDEILQNRNVSVVLYTLLVISMKENTVKSNHIFSGLLTQKDRNTRS